MNNLIVAAASLAVSGVIHALITFIKRDRDRTHEIMRAFWAEEIRRQEMMKRIYRKVAGGTQI